MYENNGFNYYNSENDGYRPNGDFYNTTPPTAPKKNGGGAKRAIALVLCCALVGGGAGVGGAALYMNGVELPTKTQIVTAPSNTENLSSSSSGSNLLTPDKLYANNLPSCVGITISNATTNVFGQLSTTAASGSGFVLTGDGYIVTNHHVIADAVVNDQMTIEVSFADGTSYPATLVGYEADNDVAVLKIEATGLQPVTIGDSDDIVVGEIVYAIGNPLGELTFTLTDGLISATDRLIATEANATMNMMQTNTAINPGNSGGPLFNEAGQLIGITTAKYSTSGNGTTVEGLGFAIPINDVVDMLTDLIDFGYVTGKPYMGVQVTSVSSEAQYYGVSAGAAVSYIAEGGAAQKAGLQLGDIIIAIDDTAVDSSPALTAAITAYRAGDTAQLTLIRQNEKLTIDITFDEKNTDTESANQIQPQEEQQQPIQPQIPSNGNGNMTQEDLFRYFFGW